MMWNMVLYYGLPNVSMVKWWWKCGWTHGFEVKQHVGWPLNMIWQCCNMFGLIQIKQWGSPKPVLILQMQHDTTIFGEPLNFVEKLYITTDLGHMTIDQQFRSTISWHNKIDVGEKTGTTYVLLEGNRTASLSKCSGGKVGSRKKSSDFVGFCLWHLSWMKFCGYLQIFSQYISRPE